MRVIFGLLVVFGVSSCVTPGSRPSIVEINLTSDIELVAYTKEELADPTRQAVIEKCQSKQFSYCGGNAKPVDYLYEISRDRISKIYVQTTLSGLDRNKLYEVELQIISPNKSLEARQISSFETPSSWQPHQAYVLTRYWAPELPRSILLGDWRFQIIVNGQHEVDRYLKVIDLYEAKTSSKTRQLCRLRGQNSPSRPHPFHVRC
jgi:hypothetical protein